MRPVTPADAGELVRLWRETWTATYGPSLDAAVLDRMLEALDGDVQAMLPGTGERGHCLAVDGRIVGSAVVAERGGTAYLWGMYVLPFHQRRGVGSRLLAAVAADVTTSRRLEARVLASSPWARAFYARHGFRPVGEESTEIMPGTMAATVVLAIDLEHLRRTTRSPAT